jgi:hypothetical protein
VTLREAVVRDGLPMHSDVETQMPFWQLPVPLVDNRMARV